MAVLWQSPFWQDCFISASNLCILCFPSKNHRHEILYVLTFSAAQKHFVYGILHNKTFCKDKKTNKITEILEIIREKSNIITEKKEDLRSIC